jgi:hypothetical protein
MKRLNCFAGFFFLTVTVWAQQLPSAPGQEQGSAADAAPMPPLAVERAVVLSVTAKILGADEKQIWSDNYSRTTLPGRTVSLQLQGRNLVAQVSFTVYPADQDSDYTLLAQGQIGIETARSGVQYRYAAQAIPVKAGEGVYFFPIGDDISQSNAVIELLISITPYKGDAEGADSDKP